MAANGGPPDVPLPSIDDLKRIDSYLGDIGTKLDNLTRMSTSWTGQMSRAGQRVGTIRTQLNQINTAVVAAGGATAQQVTQIQNLNRQLQSTQSAWKNIAKYAGGLTLEGIERFTTGLAAAGLKLFEIGLKGIFDGIKRVYEYQEKWTAAIGEMNKKIGALSPNMQGFRKEAVRWEGTIRGLGGQFGDGLKMMTEFGSSFGRILPDKQEVKWGKLGLNIAQGLGLGGEAAGAFTKSMYQLGESDKEAGNTIRDIITGARAAGISVNDFTKEVSDSREYLISFGKAGQKTFLQSAAWAKTMGVSLKSLQKFGDITDDFEGAVKAAAKLNTVFGTSINALDTVMEDDPGKRLNEFREQFISQGKSVENLSRRELKLISETMGMTVEETEGVLKSGQSLEEFQAKQEKEKKKQVQTDKLMHKALAATATTLYSFGLAFDRVTRSIMKVLKPFTNMLGLTKDGQQRTKSFGKVMDGVFGEKGALIVFLDKLADPKSDFQGFMRGLAADAKDLFTRILAYVKSDELQEWIKKVTNGAKDFYNILKSVAGTIEDVLGSNTVKSTFSWILDNVGLLAKAFVAVKLAIAAIKINSGIQNALEAFAGRTGGGPGIVNSPVSSLASGAGTLVRGAAAAGSAATGFGAAGGLAVAGGAAALAGAAGYGVGTIIDQAFGWIRKDKKTLSDLISDSAASSGIGKDIAKIFGFAGAEAKGPTMNDEKQKKLHEESMKREQERITKGKEAEDFIKKSLVARETFQKDSDRKLFQEKLHEIAIGRIQAAGGWTGGGDPLKELDEILSKVGGTAEAMGAAADKFFIDKKIIPKLANGGIVTRPTLAIVGEAGPEMVVPLKASASAEMRSPTGMSRISNGSSSVGRAGHSASSSQQFKLVAGDVYLDSKLVGRHIVRELLTQEQ